MPQSAAIQSYQFSWPVVGDHPLKALLRTAFGVALPDKQVCPNHSTPWRAFTDAYHARSPAIVWKASRGFGGKTFAAGLLANAQAIGLGADTKILGGSGEQSARVLEVQNELWKYDDAPRWMLRGEPSSRKVKLRNGASIQALFASTRSARGAHPQRLIFDEVDEMKQLILDAALGQPQGHPKKPWIASGIVLSSTHQYPDKTMTEVIKRAEEFKWPVHEWCWRETVQPHGWLDKAQVALKKRQVPRYMWDNEYELQEPSVEGRAFDSQALDRMFHHEWLERAGDVGELVEEAGLPKESVFAHGADWAKLKDWTVLATLRCDVRPVRLVSFERLGRSAWTYPLMIKQFNKRIERMPGEARHDRGGVGTVVHDELTQAAQGVNLQGATRVEIFSDYMLAVEQGRLAAPYIEYAYKEHKWCTRDDLFGSGHPPDSVVAMALAWRAAKAMVRFEDEDTPIGPQSIGTQRSYWRR